MTAVPPSLPSTLTASSLSFPSSPSVTLSVPSSFCVLSPCHFLSLAGLSSLSTLHRPPLFATFASFVTFASLANSSVAAGYNISAPSQSAADEDLPSSQSSFTAPLPPSPSSLQSTPSLSSASSAPSSPTLPPMADAPLLVLSEEGELPVPMAIDEGEVKEEKPSPSPPSPSSLRCVVRKSCAQQRRVHATRHRMEGKQNEAPETPEVKVHVPLPSPPPSDEDSEISEDDGDGDSHSDSASVHSFDPHLHSRYTRGLMGTAGALAHVPSPMPPNHPILRTPDFQLSSLSMPLFDHIFYHPTAASTFPRTGTSVLQLPIQVVQSCDVHLQQIPVWLRGGLVCDKRPRLNCNDGVLVKDQWMGFYQTTGQKGGGEGRRHFTLWATAAQYAWSTLLVQPWFARQQAKYETAVEINEQIIRLMKGFEGEVVEQINRLMMVMHCEGKVKDITVKEGYRTLHPMMYFEHLFLFPTKETMGQYIHPHNRCRGGGS